MSYIFEAGDNTLWSPSLHVGAVFIEVAEGLGRATKVPTGLTAMASDYIIVDTAAFGAFVRSLLADPAAGHPVFVQLTQGFLATCAVLLERAGHPVASENLGPLTASMASSMPV